MKGRKMEPRPSSTCGARNRRGPDERPPNRKRNHPPPSFLETTRLDGVKPPQTPKPLRYKTPSRHQRVLELLLGGHGLEVAREELVGLVGAREGPAFVCGLGVCRRVDGVRRPGVSGRRARDVDRTSGRGRATSGPGPAGRLAASRPRALLIALPARRRRRTPAVGCDLRQSTLVGAARCESWLPRCVHDRSRRQECVFKHGFGR